MAELKFFFILKFVLSFFFFLLVKIIFKIMMIIISVDIDDITGKTLMGLLRADDFHGKYKTN